MQYFLHACGNVALPSRETETPGYCPKISNYLSFLRFCREWSKTFEETRSSQGVYHVKKAAATSLRKT
ncbi:hypothetical protein M758_UG259900 [Ceratodon purpureus]|nr:hypothetical protein M758_UG259900 [Ceratodon purpureus]